MTEQGELDLMDFIAIWSLDIGLKNLALNEKQVNALMNEMQNNQDALLKTIIIQNKEIIKQNEIIISMLKEKNDTYRNI